MSKFLILILFLLPFYLHAQPTFEKRLGGIGYQDGYSVAAMGDGGFAVVGTTSTDSVYQSDIIILRTDSLGDSLWTKTYGGPNGFDFPSAVTETFDGGLLISATTYSYSTQAPNFSDWWILRTDANGDTLWTKTIPKVGNDRMMCISENDDHTILCCGWWSLNGYAKGTLLKLSETGDSLWSVQMGSSANAYAQFCMQNRDGNYLLAGGALSGTFVGVIYEYDTAGNFLNIHTYDKPGIAEIINTVHPLPQGGYLISAKSGTINGYDVWIIRTNDQWDTLWTKTFNDPIYMYDTEAKFAFDAVGDSGCVFGGLDPVNNGGQAVLYRADSTGAIQWTRSFGNQFQDQMDAIISLADGGFIFSGQADLVSNNSADIYLVRTDENGMVQGTTALESIVAQDDVLIYPNPTNGMLNWQSNIYSINEINIYSVGGTLVKIISNPSNTGYVNLKDLSEGIYIVKIISDNKLLLKKLVLY